MRNTRRCYSSPWFDGFLNSLLLAGLNFALLLFLFAGTALIQVFIGGMRPIFAIPGYTVIAITGVLSLVWLRKSRPLPNVLCLVSSALFFGYILGRAYLSPVEYVSRPDRFEVLACLVVYLVVACFLTDPKHRMLFLGLFMALAIGHVIVGVIQFVKGENYLPFNYLRADYGRRASGFYVCPNHFAGLLEILVVAAASFAVFGRIGTKCRMLLLYFALVALAGLAISGSRGGYLSTGCAFLVLLVLGLSVARQTMPVRFPTVATLSVAVCIGVLGLSVFLINKDELLADRLGTTLQFTNMRTYLWDAAMRQFHDNPVFGTGSGTYYYLGRLYKHPAVEPDPVWVHNDYIHLLAEYGVTGAVLAAFFLGTHVFYGLLSMRVILRKRLLETNAATSNSMALNLAALAGVTAMIAHSVVDFNLHIPGNALVLAILFGILANPPQAREKAGSGDRKTLKYLPWRILPAVCGVALLFDATPHIPGEWYAERARVALRDKNYRQASREAQLGLKYEQGDPNLFYYFGEAKRLLGLSFSNPKVVQVMSEEAVGQFSRAIVLFPQEEKFWIKRSQALDILGRHAEARRDLDSAFALDPNQLALHTYLGAHYQIQGKRDEALREYQLASRHEAAAAGIESVLQQIKGDAAK